jgi:hypothetical protein
MFKHRIISLFHTGQLAYLNLSDEQKLDFLKLTKNISHCKLLNNFFQINVMLYILVATDEA